jgi:hypothetical protein
VIFDHPFCHPYDSFLGLWAYNDNDDDDDDDADKTFKDNQRKRKAFVLSLI